MHPAYNFGESKGLTFDRVLIYPTKSFIEYLKKAEKPNDELQSDPKKEVIKEELPPETKAKYYAAVTRAKYSVTFVCSEDLSKYGMKKGL
jgi:DNA helicase-2/ATP-dependent DNA helicase PcrA